VQLNDIFDRIVVINLDRRPDRLAEFDEQAKSVGLTYERHSAFDAEGIVDNRGRPMRGITACTKSHYEVLDQALNDGVKRLFVFEDDANFVEDYNEKFEKTWAEVPENWDIFYGGLWLHAFSKHSERLVRPSYSYSAHAYGIDRKAMETVHRHLQGKQIIDLELSVVNSRLQAFCAKPALVYQRPSYSDLDKKFRDVTDKYV
jgi:GR25 family glycosyltransferase involved in LPS biosynthesis